MTGSDPQATEHRNPARSYDSDGLRAGLAAGLMIVAPSGFFTAALTESLPAAVKVMFVVVIVAGFTTAGAQAARVADHHVVATAGYAGLLTYLAVQLPLSLVRVARGDDLAVFTYILLALTSMSCGVTGALLVLRARSTSGLDKPERPSR